MSGVESRKGIRIWHMLLMGNPPPPRPSLCTPPNLLPILPLLDLFPLPLPQLLLWNQIFFWHAYDGSTFLVTLCTGAMHFRTLLWQPALAECTSGHRFTWCILCSLLVSQFGARNCKYQSFWPKYYTWNGGT